MRAHVTTRGRDNDYVAFVDYSANTQEDLLLILHNIYSKSSARILLEIKFIDLPPPEMPMTPT